MDEPGGPPAPNDGDARTISERIDAPAFGPGAGAPDANAMRAREQQRAGRPEHRHVMKEGVLLKRTRKAPRRWLQRWARLSLSRDATEACLEFFAPPARPEDAAAGRAGGRRPASARAAPAAPGASRVDVRRIEGAVAAGGCVVAVTLRGRGDPVHLKAAFVDDVVAWARELREVRASIDELDRERAPGGGGGGRAAAGRGG